MIKLADIFQNGMILQRQKAVRIWGETDCEQTICVLCCGKKWGDEYLVYPGAFQLELPAREAAENVAIMIKGSSGDKVLLYDVDFGEVWIAGGQSNMEFYLRYEAEGKKTIAQANDDHLRYFNVAQYAFDGEEKDGFKNTSRWNQWFPSKPEYIETFSSVAIYFSQELRKVLQVPIGIVGCNWGGTTASTWMDENLLEADDELRIYTKEYQEKTKDLELEEYLENNRIQRGSKSKLVERITRYLMEGSHRLLLKLLNPAICSFPAAPMGPCNENRPGGLYHSMVSQIAGFSCKGVLWYQGESDDHHADIYAKLFSAMIGCWRRDWAEELPFLFVQLAPFRKWVNCVGDNYPVLRQQQELVAKTVPNTWMASIMDLGMEWDIHPKRKRPVAQRLAMLARGKIYGEDILCEAPEVDSVYIKGDTLAIHFRHAGERLYINGQKLNALQLFTDHTEVREWKHELHGSELWIISKALTSAGVIELRFACQPYCEVNLYNSVGLAAKPFQYKTAQN